jgi:hydroxyacylglutathione hydrolase|tara:strand:+ start:237 stop:1001 length:765 start_codon:yes stop_codon:yes gene_type:complete
MLHIEVVPCLTDNYSYIIFNKTDNLVGVVDPSEFKTINDIISKKYKKLDYILNTHHHFDHIGGNEELKNKYNSKIICSKIDKTKILNSDITVSENEIFKFGDIIFKVISVPGHTMGHISFYSEAEKIIFTGDSLFSLGCGRIFEGTLKEMYNSLNKIKNLPKDTKIFCGHEYTKNNANFCLKYENNNKNLNQKIEWINKRRSVNLPTIPTVLEDELKTNIFLRCNNLGIKNNLNMKNSSDEQVFEKLRNLKDEF